MQGKKYKVHIVSHTHWDREWYLPFHSFRYRLHGVIRQILDRLESSSDFNHFVLDGQAILIEDHLEIHSGDKNRIRALVRGGKLSIGPWYILPDEFLVSGESTVRNLLIGCEVASQFGTGHKIGYMPDSFGHIAQMPQILQKSGIDNFIYTRGNGDELDRTGLEFWWESPDGSRILAVNQFNGYCNAGALGNEDYWEVGTQRRLNYSHIRKQISGLLKQLKKRANSKILLFNNGCDHLPAQKEFAEILGFLKKNFPDAKFVHSDYTSYLADIREYRAAHEVFRGEMLSGKYHHILPGVWSSRMYLKQKNYIVQKTLEKLLEPLATYAHFFLTQPYPANEINYMWRTLLKNHPHDSICGCSIDDVHNEMLSRFGAILQLSEQITGALLSGITPRVAVAKRKDKNMVLTVFNPLPSKRSEVIERLLFFPAGMSNKQFTIRDAQKKEIPFQILDTFYLEELWGVDFRSITSAEKQIEILAGYLNNFGKPLLTRKNPSAKHHAVARIQIFVESIPALGHKNLYVQYTGKVERKKIYPVNAAGSTIENVYYRILVHDSGMFDVFVKSTQKWLRGFNRFEDREDVGDEYDYAPAPHSRTFFSDRCSGKIKVFSTDFKASAVVDLEWPLPESIQKNRRHRAVNRRNCHLRTKITLTKHSPLIEIETRFDNQVKDHRLRVQFPSGIGTDRIYSEGQFYINDRPVTQQAGKDWIQPPAGTYPQQDFSYVVHEGRGLALFNKGLPEIEATTDQRKGISLNLTLLRCVEWLSRNDLSTRKGDAGPVRYTPAAQCPGNHIFYYAVLPIFDSDMCRMIPRLADMYTTPVSVIQGVQEKHLAGEISFLEQKSFIARISAVKLHQNRKTMVVRIYNTTANTISEVLEFGHKIQKIWKTDLLEYRLQSVKTITDRSVEFNLGPWEIVTLEIKFSGS